MLKRKFFITMAFLVALSGCSKKEEKDTKPLVFDNTTVIPSLNIDSGDGEGAEEIDLTGMGINPLTGEYIDKDIVSKRPYAVVINNLPKALPQSGIAQADIIYEVLAEGGITRMIAIFKDFNSEKIGSVRSTRTYFLDFAIDNDAIFVHHGGSEGGYENIRKNNYNHLDGMELEGKTFIRDPQRKNTPGMYEHSSFTSAAQLKEAAENKNFRLDLEDDYNEPFDFYKEDEEIPAGYGAVEVTIPYSPQSQVGNFKYDEENKKYLRFQNGNPHMDSEIDEQIAVKNIIIQDVSMRVIDDVGRRSVDLVGEGKGYLISNGQIHDITWSKRDSQSPTKWFDEKGEKLKMPAGNTWICIFQDLSGIIIDDGLEESVEPSEPKE